MGEKEEFDLAVIGAGPGGLRAAIVSANKGLRTVLFEPKELGGVCLNAGCIPVKAMLHASSVYHETRNELGKFGIEVPKAKINFKKLMARVHGIVEDEHDEIKKMLKNKNLTLVREKASFVDGKTLLAGKKNYTAKKILIATGAKARVHQIKGIEKVKYRISDDVLKLEKMPKSIVVIGGGYISMELSTFFHDLGVQVYVLERSETILGHLDSDVSELITTQYIKEGMPIYTCAEILEVMQKGKNKIVKFKVKDKIKKIESEELFIITGRTPNTMGLNLEAAGIEKSEKGNIVVNEKLQTTNPNVFAVGDVNGRSFFANIAQREGQMVVENMFNGTSQNYNPSFVPWATGTRPKLSHVGLSENQAKEKGINAKHAKADINKAAGAKAFGHTAGFAKVTYEPTTKKILGCTLLCHSAEEIIHEVVAIMQMGGTIDDLKRMMHVHPTLAEVFEFLHTSS